VLQVPATLNRRKLGDYAESIKMQDARQTLPDIRLLMPKLLQAFFMRLTSMRRRS